MKVHCFFGRHRWAPLVECSDHQPSHTVESWCVDCNKMRHDEGCPKGLPRATPAHHERARKLCAELSAGTDGNVPVQSVYEALVRGQLDACEERRKAMAGIRLGTTGSNVTVTNNTLDFGPV